MPETKVTEPVVEKKCPSPPAHPMPLVGLHPEPAKPKPVEQLFHRTLDLPVDAVKSLRRVHRPDLNINRPPVNYIVSQRAIEKKSYGSSTFASDDHRHEPFSETPVFVGHVGANLRNNEGFVEDIEME